MNWSRLVPVHLVPQPEIYLTLHLWNQLISRNGALPPNFRCKLILMPLEHKSISINSLDDTYLEKSDVFHGLLGVVELKVEMIRLK
jgi:hypothetical protein